MYYYRLIHDEESSPVQLRCGTPILKELISEEEEKSTAPVANKLAFLLPKTAYQQR